MDLMLKQFETEVEQLISTCENVLFAHSSKPNRHLHHILERVHENKSRHHVKVAFVGQYSAGKSTIVTALTGRDDILIDQNVSTDTVAEYPWGNIYLYDTPGIYAGKKEHDLETLRYIDQADLIVYVVTVNGFDALIGQNFRKLIIEENRTKRTMLVVNKISTEQEANEKNWKKDILKVIHPLTEQDVRLTFIDAKDYLEHLEEEDEADAKELLELSHFAEFKQKLDLFSFEVGLFSKLAAPLNEVMMLCRESIISLSSNSEEMKQEMLEIDQQIRFVKLSKNKLEQTLLEQLRQFDDTIFDHMQHHIDQIHLDMTKSEQEQLETVISNGLSQELQTFLAQLDEQIEDHNEQIKERIAQFVTLPLGTTWDMGGLDPTIEMSVKSNKSNPLLDKVPDALKDVGYAINDIAGSVKDLADSTREIVGESSNIKVSELTVYVQKIYNLIGKNIDLTEAADKSSKLAKTASSFGAVGKVMSKSNIVVQPAMAIMTDVQQQKASENLLFAKENVRSNIMGWKASVKRDLAKQIKKAVNENYDLLTSELNRKAASYLSDADLQNETIVKLRQLLVEAEILLAKY